MLEIRKAIADDTSQLAEVMKSAEESGYMLFNPGERKVSVEGFANFIDKINIEVRSALFVACENGKISGYMIVQQDKPERISHRAYLVVGVHSESRGKGIGKALFSHVEEWARKVGFHRLDLTVIAENKAAVGLYQKMGFQIEGIKQDSLLINGQFIDEYYMAKLIGRN
ncbi:GNAT family N-acetyltransferase [Planococcus sp. N028]|uniref:GNAT family N-acetyltransferase n=1 Tax=Planococcus shixiaomingii TaxID=3058393 RepID=A0ABT8MYQ8_9BACL|nr:GNAT family N-acetyltransferase [Planococcus sp. N028]MDN7240730.1 GNAT family N-acetyltransferase [Planococcus sp. N028]